MSHISGLIGMLFYYYPDKLINKLGHEDYVLVAGSPAKIVKHYRILS